MSPRAPLLVACLVAGALGCSLLVSVDDDLSGGAPDAASSVTGPEAGADVAERADTGPAAVPFCSTQGATLFCEDFDARDLGAAFDAQRVRGGSLARTEAFFVSPGHAMDVRLVAQGATTGDATAVGTHTFDAAGALLVDLKVRIDERSPATANGPFTELVTFDYPSAPDSFWQIGVRLLSTATGAALELFLFDSAKATTVPIGSRAAVADKEWTTLRLAIDVPARTAVVRRIDASGSPVLTSGTFSPPGAPTFPARWNMNLGLFAYGVQAGWRVQFDDVAVRTP